MKSLPGENSALRREILKQYIFALVAEGAFAGVSSKTGAIIKATTILAQDASAVISDMFEAAGDKFGAALLAKAADAVGVIRRRGFTAIVNDIKAQYARGVEANANGNAHKRR